MKKYKLLIVDDEKEICSMLKEYFSMLGYLVYAAGSGQEALDLLDTEPDLILLDVNMPGMDGLEVCRQIRDSIHVPILFLTAKIEEQDRVEGFMAGGDDYILKPFSMEELQARVMAHLRREERRTDKKMVMNFGTIMVDYEDRKITVQGKEVDLTKTEFGILELLSRNRGRSFDKETIYEKLWGYDKDGNSESITEHVRRIRNKLGRFTDQKVIETVWGVGYRWIL